MSLLRAIFGGKPVRRDPHGILTAMVEARRNSPEIVAYRKNRAAQIQRRGELA